MAHIDRRKKIIQAKLVYYGPGLCGKTANLEYINRNLCKGEELMSLATEGDRTIFFDFMPLESDSIAGMKVSFRLYTVPGQVRYSATRKMVLKNVDGIVFVADSQTMMLDSNVESLEDLVGNLKELGIHADNIDLVLQYNKRDLPEVLPKDELDQALNDKGYPVFLSSALTGQGVLETLRHTAKLVLRRIAQDLKEDAEVNVTTPAGPSGLVGASGALPPETSGKGDAPDGVETPPPPQIPPRTTIPAAPARTTGKKRTAAAAVPLSPASVGNVPASAGSSGVVAAAVKVPRDPPSAGDDSQSVAPPPPAPIAARAMIPGGPTRPAQGNDAGVAVPPSPAGAASLSAPTGPSGVVTAAAGLPRAPSGMVINTPPPAPVAARAAIPTAPAQAPERNGAAAAAVPLSPTGVLNVPASAEPSGAVGEATASPGEASGEGDALQNVEPPPGLPPVPAWATIAPVRASATLKNGATSLAVPVSPAGVANVRAAPTAQPWVGPTALQVATAVVALPDVSRAGAAASQTADGSSLRETTVPVNPLSGEPTPRGAYGAGPGLSSDVLAAVERRLDALSAMVGSASTVHEQLRSEAGLLRGFAMQLVKSNAAGKEELGVLSKELAALSRKEDLAALRKELVALADKAQGHRDGLAAALCRELEALPSSEDVAVLRKEVATLAEKAPSDRPGLDPAALHKDLELLPSKEDMASLRREMVALVEKAQSRGGGFDPAALRQELAALPTRQEVAALTKLVESLGAEIAALRGSFDQALGEIRRAPLEPGADGGQPGSSEPKGEAARPEEGRVGQALSATEEPQAKSEATQPEEMKAKPEETQAEETQPEEAQPEEAQTKREETPPDQAQAKPEEEQVKPDETRAEETPAFERQPEHVNAARVARVMVADLNLYHRTEVEEGIKAGDLYQRIKETLDDMKMTYASRIPEDIRNQKDYLMDELEKMIAKKRKSLGIE